MISSINIDCNRYILIRFPWSTMIYSGEFQKISTKLSFKPNFSTGWWKIISLNCIFSKLRSSVKKKLGRDFLELTGVDHSDPHTYFRKIDTRFMLVYFFFYLPKWLMTSLWLLSRIRFGVVEMGFEPENVTKITSYHITST